MSDASSLYLRVANGTARALRRNLYLIGLYVAMVAFVAWTAAGSITGAGVSISAGAVFYFAARAHRRTASARDN